MKLRIIKCINILIMSSLASLGCTANLPNIDKMANAAVLICDSMESYQRYQPQLEMIKSLVEQKDYMTALFYAKGMYVEAQHNGDAKMLEEIIPLIDTLQTMASKVPLKVVKPESDLKLL